MKLLITHINPHLDDIFAIWLLKKFDPKFKDFEIDFISASHMGNEETEDKIFVGTGGGKFDEHKEGLHTCAGTLVFDYLKKENKLPQDDLTVKALGEIVKWNQDIDMGKAPISEFGEFSIQAFIRSKDSKKETSLEDVELGSKILDRVLWVLKQTQKSIKDWENRVEFDSRFGKSFAIQSESIDRPFCKRMGGDLFLLYNPKYKGVQFFTPSAAVDLSLIYNKLKQIDPIADWFLHQSHHMVLCGSSSAPEAKQTKLSFEQLVDLTKSI
jgi:hypothetical protein